MLGFTLDDLFFSKFEQFLGWSTEVFNWNQVHKMLLADIGMTSPYFLTKDTLATNVIREILVKCKELWFDYISVTLFNLPVFDVETYRALGR